MKKKVGVGWGVWGVSCVGWGGGGGEESSIINSMTQHKLEHGGQLLTVNRLISFSTTSVDLISLFANRLL